jgi:hypothetical protein
MATTQLGLYNDALGHVGERKLASLSENREPRRLLDAAWTTAKDYCLEQGLWNFALRTARLDSAPEIEPDFGYRKGFERPDDYIRLAYLCQDEYFKVPLLDYQSESNYWFADLDPIYLRYVSNDDHYGGDFSLWPTSFTFWVGLYLAWRIAPKLVQSENAVALLDKKARSALIDAQSKDAMSEPTRFPPTGAWNASRNGRVGLRNRPGYR